MSNCCCLRSGPMKTRANHHLSKWRRVVTTATVLVNRLSCKNDLFNADKQIHNTNYELGLPKYQSCALPSTKDGTHDTQQVSALCKRMTNHFRKTYCLWKYPCELSPFLLLLFRAF